MIRLIVVLMMLSSCIVSAKEVEVHTIGNGKPKILFISGIHGDEVSGVALLRELLSEPLSLQKGTLVFIPEANKRAVAEKKRTPYYMADLNRAFPGNKNSLTEIVAMEIFEEIETLNPDLVVDFHESYYNFDENKDPKYYIGNSIITSADTFEKFDSFIIDLDMNLLLGSPEGSLNYEVSERLKIPVITVETSREEDLNVRIKKAERVLKKTLEHFKMEQ